jgi:deazaflavin-dependent oxidoreductase (nitroreductase family)
MSTTDKIKDFGFRFVPRFHRALLTATGGRILSSFSGMPVVQLQTTGRKSGLRRTTTLTAPIIETDRVVLVASKGGDDRNPEWFLNLTAHPDVELTVGGQTRLMRARVASPAEKAELWPAIVGKYKGYGLYQKRTSRDIPVVICTSHTPRPGLGS